jgi:RNA polymerase sigma-70 factor, ECF subfamily
VPPADLPWLQPYPDLLLGEGAEPEEEAAAVLEMNVAAANSALQRARATMAARLAAIRLEWATAAYAEDAERSLLQTYMEAFERHDASQLVAILREDVRLAMPPHPAWYEGRLAVVAFLAGIAFAPGSEAHRMVPTRANRQPAFGVYRGEGADARPFAINVLQIESGLVTDMHFFKYPEFSTRQVARSTRRSPTPSTACSRTCTLAT